MAATRDETCNLIERVAAQRPSCPVQPVPKSGYLDTPLADDLSERLAAGTSAVATLLAVGCIVDELRVSPARCEITLHRAPPEPAVRGHDHTIDTRGEHPTARIVWSGNVAIEWPVQVRS